jgi:endoglucanase
MKSRAIVNNRQSKKSRRIGICFGFLLLCLTSLLSSSSTWAFYTENGRIYRDDGVEINLYGVSWFGFETGIHVVHGLWERNYKDMIQQIRSQFTAIRLPFCPATLQGVGIGGIDFSQNQDLLGLNSLEILDRVVQELDRQGIYILIDHHSPDCKNISPLWYTDIYSEQDWINDLVFVATRYQNLPHFLGIDLKNEPHDEATWGTDDLATDWKLAAERAAAAILAANPSLLIFVEGIQENPVCSNDISHWWGGNLEPVACFPLAIPSNKLVLSPHVYGPDVFFQPYWDDPDFPDNMPAIWEAHFGFLTGLGYTVVIGEFGGKYGHGGDPRDKLWQDKLIAYMLQKGLTNFFYWTWNPNSSDTGGILKNDWQTIWQDKIDLLCPLMGCPIIGTLSLPTAEVEAPYNAPLVTGGVAPYTATLTEGIFPPGLTFDPATGNLVGMPSSSALLGKSFTIQITDQVGRSVTGTFNIKIKKILRITTSALRAGASGKGYREKLLATGGKTPRTWSELTGNLAAMGLSLNPSNGVISGTPPSAGGPTILTFRVVDDLGGEDQKVLNLTIN